MDWAPTSLAYARTHADPIVWFDCPDDVVDCPDLSRAEKLDILRRWHRQTLARAADATLDERSRLLSGGIARAIRRASELPDDRSRNDASGARPLRRATRAPWVARGPRRRGTAGA